MLKEKKPESTSEQLKEKLQVWLQNTRAALIRFGHAVYLFEYALGMYTLTALHRGFRYLRKELRPMFGWLEHFVFQKVIAYLITLFKKFVGVRHIVKQEFSRERTPFKTAPFRAVGDWFSCIVGVSRRYPAVLGRVLRVLCPLAACGLLIFTIQYWSSATFGIQVEYEGVDVGTITDETTYRNAADMARARVYSEDGEFTISDTPRMRVTLTRANAMLDTTALCDAILRTKGDAISEGSGLYIDGNFIGSMTSRAEMDKVLNDIKGGYLQGVKNERAEFIQNVEVSDGLFLSESVMTAEQLKAKLTAQAVVKKEYTIQPGDTLSTIARDLDMTTTQLRNMNPSVKNDTIYAGDKITVQRPQPFLRVKVVRTIQYTEKIDYSIEKEYDDSKLVTYEKVKVKGEEGSQNVTAEVTFIDGVEESRTILSIDVTKQPVSQVVIVGTKKVYNSDGGSVTVGDGISTGNMLWPVPICHNMSRGWRSGHYALDICNGPVSVKNQPFVAADGGTVISAGWNTGGYGYLVQIQHANGLQTWYAHCNSLYVVTGQKVTRGQVLGRIGSTGWSTGYHLHFEVRKNGRRVNPLNYVSP